MIPRYDQSLEAQGERLGCLGSLWAALPLWDASFCVDQRALGYSGFRV